MSDLNLRFPIGRYKAVDAPSDAQVSEWIETLERFPDNLHLLVDSLSLQALEWNYRPGSWSIKQVVHHCADSHMNSLIRFKLTLTEELPTIRPYLEAEWAKLIDSNESDLSYSLQIISAVHGKWVLLLKNLSAEQFQRKYIHPESGREFSLAQALGLYAWHAEHHLKHIENALLFKGHFPL